MFAISRRQLRSPAATRRRSELLRFSRYPLIWGWATWRRAWDHFDPRLEQWGEQRDTDWLVGLLGDPLAATFWGHRFDQARGRRGLVGLCLVARMLAPIGGLCALPAANLVSNLGFRPDATHTKVGPEFRSPFAAIPTIPIGFPLRHPAAIQTDPETDAFLEEVVFSGNLKRTFSRLREARALRDAVA